jgi:hypothetical protein
MCSDLMVHLSLHKCILRKPLGEGRESGLGLYHSCPHLSHSYIEEKRGLQR